MRKKLLYPLVFVWAVPALVFGQGSRYLQFDFNDDLETVLKQRLGRNAEIESLLNMLKKLPPDLLSKFNIDPQSVQLKADGSGITTSDRTLKDKLERMLKDLPKLSADDRKAAEQAAKRIRGKENPPEDIRPTKESRPPPPRPAPDRQPRKKEEEINRATRDVMKDLEQSRLGDLLKGSRAWQRGLEELQRGAMSGGKGMDLSFLERWTGRLSLPDGLKLDISDSLLGKLRNWTGPSLPRVNLPRLGGFNPVNLPSFGRPGAIPWEGVLVAGVILAAGALLWQLLVRPPKKGNETGPGWRLGPWPVKPGNVSNPAEFIQAFEHLALLRLGLPARNWHHRRIAERLGHETDDMAAAKRLMHLYEEARYAPMTSWSETSLVVARRDLCLLAGVPAA